MKEIIIALFGEYMPTMTMETVQGIDGLAVPVEVVAHGIAGVDFVWIAGVLLFALVLWSFFRLVGVVLKQ